MVSTTERDPTQTMMKNETDAQNLKPHTMTLEQAYIEACDMELLAFKPGNVSVYSEGHDMTVEDFRISARVSAPEICKPHYSLGEKIYYAIKATREACGCNTNLGIVLLAAPMIQAVQMGATDLRVGIQHVLESSTVQDAQWVYQAIRCASPGGLGQSEEQDVESSPEVTLLQAMKIAENKDRIAWQYTNSYADVFDLAIPSYHSVLNRWEEEEWATLAVYSGLLKRHPDSHIERKFGTQFTRRVADRMTLIDQSLSDSARPEQLIALLREVDAEFKSDGINPGTTADLTVACLLAVRLDLIIKRTLFLTNPVETWQCH